MATAALWLYRTVMVVLLPILAPWLLIAYRRRRRDGLSLRQRLGWGLPEVQTGGVWVQAVSVGEVAAARSILAELRRRRPEMPLILSATTATGLQMASGHQVADAVVAFPLDLSCAVRRFLESVSPRVVVLLETELWPEMLAQCGRRQIPVLVANARISDRSYRRYYAIRHLLRPLLRPVTVALAQEVKDAERLAALGIPQERITVTGNVKFDASPPSAYPPLVGQVRETAHGRPIWVAGSTVAGEEELVLDAFLQLPSATRPLLVLAPRHPERAADVDILLAARGIPAVRRTQLGSPHADVDVVLVDTVGELASLFSGALAAFIGGSLVSGGGHNPIEPARYGVPVLTGPHVRNFEAVYHRFVEAGAAEVVHDSHELAAVLSSWLADREAAARVGAAGRELLAANAGATARIADAVEGFLR